MNAAVGEIKKLNDQLSQLRQENINLKVSEEWRKVREDKKAPVLSPWARVDTNSQY